MPRNGNKISRKSRSSRISFVPSIIKDWFSPRRSSYSAVKTCEHDHTGERSVVEGIKEPTLVDGPSEDRAKRDVTDIAGVEALSEVGGTHDIKDDDDDKKDIGTIALKRADDTETGDMNVATGIQDETHSKSVANDTAVAEAVPKGLATDLGYYVPLCNLKHHANPATQQSFADKLLDVFGVIVKDIKSPKKAISGRRDYYVKFAITDMSLPIEPEIKVEVFRPWVATLPAAQAGDVVLLRGFTVKSRRGQPYLLSTASSSWCVWRYHCIGNIGTRKSSTPIRHAGSTGLEFLEEVKGPPVEYGESEKEHAARLRAWWVEHV